MAQIKIVFSTSKNRFSAILRWAQRCPYSHCEAIIDSVDEIIGARSAGVSRFSKKLPSRTLRHEIKTINCSNEQKRKFEEFMLSQVGKKYDWKAYLGFLYPKGHFENPEKWFCSELIFEALNYAGIKMFNEDLGSEVVMPRDIFVHKFLKKSDERLSYEVE